MRDSGKFHDEVRVNGAAGVALADATLARLRGEGARLAVVESCTGGLLAHWLTDIPGASDVFWASVTAYDNSAKTGLLHVPPEVLARFGAVSEETATALADGGIRLLKAHLPAPAPVSLAPGQPYYCVSTTGIAGPGGGTPAKPVGLCYVAVACTHAPTRALRIQSPEGLDRPRAKSWFAARALELLLETRPFQPMA